MLYFYVKGYSIRDIKEGQTFWCKYKSTVYNEFVLIDADVASMAAKPRHIWKIQRINTNDIYLVGDSGGKKLYLTKRDADMIIYSNRMHKVECKIDMIRAASKSSVYAKTCSFDENVENVMKELRSETEVALIKATARLQTITDNYLKRKDD